MPRETHTVANLVGTHISTFFFFVSYVQNKWFGVLHHLVGEHGCHDGQCSHGPLAAAENGKPILDKGGPQKGHHGQEMGGKFDFLCMVQVSCGCIDM